MRILTLSGKLGADANVKLTKTGTQFIEFRIGNNEFGDENGQTYWFRCISFNSNHINLAQYLTKGRPIEVIGTLKTRGYVNQKTNRIEVAHDIKLSEILFDSNMENKNNHHNEKDTTTKQKTEDKNKPIIVNNKEVKPFSPLDNIDELPF